jgi:hypothetical protein
MRCLAVLVLALLVVLVNLFSLALILFFTTTINFFRLETFVAENGADATGDILEEDLLDEPEEAVEEKVSFFCISLETI